MERQNSFSDLLESIKKELKTIIVEGSASEKHETQHSLKDLDKDEKIDLEQKISGLDMTANPIEQSKQLKPNISNNSRYNELLKAEGGKNIDDDVQKMKVDLMKSYELFQRIGEKFETINFGSLKTRIRDLHLNNKNNSLAKTTSSELEHIFNSRINENRLDKLTTDMGNKFRKHPGEFGDIPEISEFFKACTQLEHGLEQIKRQRIDAMQLEKRMVRASEAAYNRIDEIRSTISNDK